VKKLKIKSIVFLLLMGCCSISIARLIITPLPEKVTESDVIAVATCTAPAEKRGIVSYIRVKDFWNITKWEYSESAGDKQDQQIQDYLKELNLLAEKMDAKTNYYACSAIYNEYRRHQREYAVPFSVDLLIKGSVTNNEFSLLYTEVIPVAGESKQSFKKGKKYVLFLKNSERHPKKQYLLPEFGEWEVFVSVYPVSTNYFFVDEWEITHAGNPSVPLSSERQIEKHQGSRNFTHKQLIQRIKQLIEIDKQ